MRIGLVLAPQDSTPKHTISKNPPDTSPLSNQNYLSSPKHLTSNATITLVSPGEESQHAMARTFMTGQPGQIKNASIDDNDCTCMVE